MMGLPKQNTLTTSASDFTEDDHAKRKRERETSADLLNDHEDEEVKAPIDAEGTCPPKKSASSKYPYMSWKLIENTFPRIRGKETEEDSETTSVRKNMEEMVCQDQNGGEAEETCGEKSTTVTQKISNADETKVPEDAVSDMTGKETTAHGNQMRSSQSSSKAAAEFIPSKRSENTNTALKPTIPQQSSTLSYTLPESSFSRNRDTQLQSTTPSNSISNPFLKNVEQTNDDDGDDVDDPNNVKNPKNSANTRTRENEDLLEPSKKKYAFGQTLGPGAADIGRSNPAIAPTPPTTGSTSSLSSATTSAFGAKYAGATFGSTAASGNSIFGSGWMGTGAASNTSPFGALSTTGESTTSLKQGPSVFNSEATMAVNKTNENDDDDDRDDKSDQDDDTNNGDDGAGVAFGSNNNPLVPEQEVITGEEDEMTLHQIKGKLFAMENGQWRERGGGNLKLKISMKDEGGRKPRLVMRTDAVLRLILNTPLFAGMAMKIVQEKFVIFGGVEKDGKPMSYGFRAPSPIAAADLCEAIDKALSEYL